MSNNLELGGGLIKPNISIPDSMLIYLEPTIYDIPLTQEQRESLLDKNYLSGITMIGQLDKLDDSDLIPVVLCAPINQRDFIIMPLPLIELDWIELELSNEGEYDKAVFVFGYISKDNLEKFPEFDGW